MDKIRVGAVENPELLNIDPIEAEVTGYDCDRQPVVETFRFRGATPTGASLDVLRGMNEEGDVPVRLILGFLDACLLGPELARWEAFIHDPDVFIEQGTLIELYKALAEVYAERPTLRQSDSPAGLPNSNGTSSDAAPSPESTGGQSL